MIRLGVGIVIGYAWASGWLPPARVVLTQLDALLRGLAG